MQAVASEGGDEERIILNPSDGQFAQDCTATRTQEDQRVEDVVGAALGEIPTLRSR